MEYSNDKSFKNSLKSNTEEHLTIFYKCHVIRIVIDKTIFKILKKDHEI